MKFTIYILKSEIEEWHYVGMTTNLENRPKDHNSGHVKSTKSRRPYSIVFTEDVEGRENTRKREKQLKNGFAKKRVLNKK